MLKSKQPPSTKRITEPDSSQDSVELGPTSTAAWYHLALDAAMLEEQEGDWLGVTKNVARRIRFQHGEKIAVGRASDGPPLQPLTDHESELLEAIKSLVRRGADPEEAALAVVSKHYNGPSKKSAVVELLLRRL